MIDFAKTTGLFVLTAIAEIVGCYFPYLWLKKHAAVLKAIISRPRSKALDYRCCTIEVDSIRFSARRDVNSDDLPSFDRLSRIKPAYESTSLKIIYER